MLSKTEGHFYLKPAVGEEQETGALTRTREGSCMEKAPDGSCGTL